MFLPSLTLEIDHEFSFDSRISFCHPIFCDLHHACFRTGRKGQSKRRKHAHRGSFTGRRSRRHDAGSDHRGQNNHGAWPKTTVLMRQVLEATGKFRVDIQRTKFTWKGDKLLKQFPLDDGKKYDDLDKSKPDPDFHPTFSDYNVVISNFGWNAADWPEQTRKDFEAYMTGGGGLVVVHAADNSFPGWDEYNKMIGLGGWGGRTEKSGPYVYFDEKEKQVRDTSAGRGPAFRPGPGRFRPGFECAAASAGGESTAAPQSGLAKNPGCRRPSPPPG